MCSPSSISTEPSLPNLIFMSPGTTGAWPSITSTTSSGRRAIAPRPSTSIPMSPASTSSGDCAGSGRKNTRKPSPTMTARSRMSRRDKTSGSTACCAASNSKTMTVRNSSSTPSSRNGANMRGHTPSKQGCACCRRIPRMRQNGSTRPWNSNPMTGSHGSQGHTSVWLGRTGRRQTNNSEGSSTSNPRWWHAMSTVPSSG